MGFVDTPFKMNGGFSHIHGCHFKLVSYYCFMFGPCFEGSLYTYKMYWLISWNEHVVLAQLSSNFTALQYRDVCLIPVPEGESDKSKR